MMKVASQVAFRWFMAGFACGSVACIDATPVGRVECVGKGVRCGAALKADPTQQPELRLQSVSSTNLPELSPTWTRAVFDERDDPFSLALIVDADGGLYSLSARDGHVSIRHVDGEGATQDEREIAAPPQIQAHAGLFFAPITTSPGAATTLQISWTGACSDKHGAMQACQVDEALVFESISEPPRRFGLVSSSEQLVAQQSTTWLVSSAQHPHVDRVDTHGDVVWRQTGVLGPQGWQLQGAALPDDKLAVFLGPLGGELSAGNELWVLDSQGNITSRVPVLLNMTQPVLRADSQGQLALVAGNDLGDLVMARLSTNGAMRGFEFAREEYSVLNPDLTALDLDGNLYAITHVGGRLPADQRVMLCQTDFSVASCFTLHPDASRNTTALSKIDALAAPEAGVVYMRSGSKLSRYDLAL